ncbi:Na+/H+ antiporter subunit E [Gillisia hiemivivida]|jgi:multicomponent Na+:H+ antiporter subunit E|uniref:Cation:proton antiporter n=1 Tax=Gillisia hiemivivida TaxID=291190 RepID=A0A5C6ZTB0_9FLAO|nr:Na+/H+ antiporter subunit E [Gillisia hiemivivida]TXD92425.1 cation:proton antiporter [Gillisia hiemivivida]
MKLLIPHIILSIILAVLFFNVAPYEGSANRYILAGIVIFSLTWPLSYFFSKDYFRKLPGLMGLIVFFTKELIVANFRVAYDVVTPITYMRPCIVALPLDAKTDFEITVLACMISLTPGTLSLNLSDDKSLLFVHAITFKKMDPEAIKRDLKEGFEKKLLKITR